MRPCIYWFRSDLRLHDHAGLARALGHATHLLPVYCHDPAADQPGPWGFAPLGRHRRRFLADCLAELDAQLCQRGSALLEVRGRPRDVLPALLRAVGADAVFCEDIAEAGAIGEVVALRAAGVAVQTLWHSSLLDPNRLPYPVTELPRFYTPFRQSVEKAGVTAAQPRPAPERLPPLPAVASAALDDIAVLRLPQALSAMRSEVPAVAQAAMEPAVQSAMQPAARPGAASPAPVAAPSCGLGDAPDDPRSSFPYRSAAFSGGEAAALDHLARYFSGPAAPAYKSTRNRLSGIDTSTKFSAWLAAGALSPRVVMSALRDHENRQGTSDGSYAIWFELLWRDFFRLLALRARARAAAGEATGTSGTPTAGPYDEKAFVCWCEGRTGEALVDAAMRELAATGFLSNRLRQVVASFLIHELRGDPRAGAAWFAAQLVDFDSYNNDGNWHYIAGTGADPRGGRHFNLEKQARDHDPDGQYRMLWGTG